MNNEEDYYTIDAMEKFGGSFVKALANCARHADHNNFSKLKNTFSEYFDQYRAMGKKLKEKEIIN